MTWKKHYLYKNYEANENGDIRHVVNKRIRKPRLDKDGYQRINIVHDGKRITIKTHAFIATVFCPRPRSADTVNHINGNKEDNRPSNLEWITSAENIIHSHKTGMHSKCHPVSIGGKSYYSKREAERQTGIKRATL